MEIFLRTDLASSTIRIENPALVALVGLLLLGVGGALVFMLVKGLQGLGPAWRQMHRCFFQVGHQLGMTYREEPGENPALLEAIGEFKFTSRKLPAWKHRWSHLLEGSFQHEGMASYAAFLDFTSRLGGAGGVRAARERSVRQTVLYLAATALPRVSFRLRPAGLLRKLAAVAGIRKTNPAGNPEFSRSFHLACAQPGAAAGVFGPAVVELLEANPELCVESDGQGALILYRKGRQCAEKLRATVESHDAVAKAYREMLLLGLELARRLSVASRPAREAVTVTS